MFKNKKVITIFFSLTFIIAFIAGCVNLEGTELIKAFTKAGTINSAESDTKLTISLDAQGLSQSEADSFDQVKELVDNLQINFFTKFLQNPDKTTLKSYTQLSTNSQIMPFKTEIWLNQNFTGKTPIVKEIIKSPDLFSLTMPYEFTNKYMVLDLEQMKKDPQTKDIFASLDFSKISQSNNQLKEKIAEFVDKYINQYDLGFNPITDKGTAQVDGVDVHNYELKLSDASFKTLIRKSFNDFSKNTEAMNFIKDYMLLSIQSGGLSGTELDNATKEIELAFAQLADETTQTQFNSFMDKLDNITLLGDKGIDITYSINNDGYIIKEIGTIQIVLDVKKLDELVNDLSGTTNTTVQDLTGIYTIELGYESNINKINSLVDSNFTYPILNTKNSFTLKQLLVALNPPPPVRKVPTVTLAKKQSAKVYKKIYYVKVKDVVTKLKGKYSYKEGNAIIKINGKTIKLQLGRKYITLNGKKVKLKTINGIISKKKLYIPINVYTMAGVKIKLK